ncbi:GLPGLI family protein [Pedobacter zeae]|uniref:GLPGLI family protein n=1 Tax=Pedobacter zeae TaxID=1737356 RepID=A0A7W6K9R3_9SPHI|nr:GLPGLI family protein [Pedobacter zeae]MBB4106745.1 GLPGLI family protein [Pedobacter zeae]GGH03498.1 GLPGLI family protein [Pedobacter zeae]
MYFQKLSLLCFFCACIFSFTRAQTSGRAIYKSSSNITTRIDTTKAGSADQKDLNTLIRKSMQKEYLLNFNRYESVYKEIKELENASQTGKIDVIGIGSGTEGGIYKDMRNKVFAESRDGFGKLFLIEDTLVSLPWKLTEETKQIGGITCYKATAYLERKVTTNVADEQGKITAKEKKIKTNVTAWYAPSIPVNNGPALYWGLPGLILEISDGRLTLLCSEIVLNDKTEAKIEKPKKGQKVSQGKFDEIYEKKVNEMQEMYRDNRKKTGQ